MGYTKKSNKAKTWAAKRERELKYKNKLKSLSNISIFHPSVVMLVESDKHRTVKKPYYKRIYLSAGRKGRTNFFKKVANRKTRRYKGDISDGCNYKKIYDYWWTVT